MGNKIVKPSFYNILIKKEDGIAIFNTRTGKMARCFHGDAKIVEEHLSQKYIEWSHDNQYIVPMYKNGLLVDYNLDEISEMIDKEKDSKFENCLRLILLPTEQCNFRCVYCYERFRREECLRYAMQKENLHVGIDLIVGLPNSKIIDFDNDIKIVRELGIKNIFIYSYRLEEKSFFYNYFDKKKCFLQNDMIRKMEYAEERIKNFGYIAKSIYYWSIEKDSLYRYTSHQMNGGEWVGIGDGAYSYLEHSVMHNNFIGRNYQKYLNEIKQNQIFAQNVTSQMIWDISLMVKKDVFDTKRIIQKYGKIVEPYLRKLGKRLEENGYSQNRNNKVCLSVKGKVLLDDVDKIIQEVVLN